MSLMKKFQEVHLHADPLDPALHAAVEATPGLDAQTVAAARQSGFSVVAILGLIVQYGTKAMEVLQLMLGALHQPPPPPATPQAAAEQERTTKAAQERRKKAEAKAKEEKAKAEPKHKGDKDKAEPSDLNPPEQASAVPKH